MPDIELEGLKDAQRALRNFGGSGPEAKALNRHIVDKLLVPPSKAEAPKRSGRLAASIRATASPTYGYIIAGVRGRIPYGAIIHFGWAFRGMGLGKLTGGIGQRRKQIQAAGLAAGGGVSTRALNKAARLSTAQVNKQGVTTRNRVRGGPIEPNPFIYRAIDRRRRAVFEEYEYQLERRAKIEGLL